jgi:RNA-directed DNA polymerase
MTVGNRKWQFFGKFSNGNTILLRMFALFKIRRHKLIAGGVNPFDPLWDDYIYKRKLCRILT